MLKKCAINYKFRSCEEWGNTIFPLFISYWFFFIEIWYGKKSAVASALFECQYNVCVHRVKIWCSKHIFRNLIFSKWAAYHMVLQISNHEFRIFTIDRSGCQKCFATIRDWKTRETMWWAAQQWMSHLIQYWCSIFYLTNQELPDSQTNYKLDVLC